MSEKKDHWKDPIPSDNIHYGCLNCSTVQQPASLDMVVGVGFGVAQVTKDGEIIWSEAPDMEFDDMPALQKFEDMAIQDPDHDWRVEIFGPMHGETYQRQGVRNWVIIESNEGFA
jgi:hypothetical protein